MFLNDVILYEFDRSIAKRVYILKKDVIRSTAYVYGSTILNKFWLTPVVRAMHCVTPSHHRAVHKAGCCL